MKIAFSNDEILTDFIILNGGIIKNCSMEITQGTVTGPFLYKSFKTLLYNKEYKCFIDIETYFNEPGWSYPCKKKIFKATLYRGFNDIDRNEIYNFKNEIENVLKESLIYEQYNFLWNEKMLRFYNKNRFQKILSKHSEIL